MIVTIEDKNGYVITQLTFGMFQKIRNRFLGCYLWTGNSIVKRIAIN